MVSGFMIGIEVNVGRGVCLFLERVLRCVGLGVGIELGEQRYVGSFG